MSDFVVKYINPFTDYGFKRLFGEEPNKDLLKDFLNELLREEQGEITELTYLKNERFSRKSERRAIFDLYCTNQNGNKFIVEIQKAKQKYFKERSVFYSTFPIIEQGIKNDWDFDLKAVYTIGILDFVFDEDKDDLNKYRYDIKLTDIETCEVFYDKLTYRTPQETHFGISTQGFFSDTRHQKRSLTELNEYFDNEVAGKNTMLKTKTELPEVSFIYLEMPKFKKTLDELETKFDKWMYVIANLHRLERIPDKLQESIFEKLFKVAEIANFTISQYNEYEGSLKVYRDLKNTQDYALEVALEAKVEKITINLLNLKASDEMILQVTGLTQSQLDNIKKKSNEK